MVRVERPLFFGNADYVRERVRALVADGVRVVVIDAETSPSLDVSAVEMLGRPTVAVDASSPGSGRLAADVTVV